MTLPGIIVQKQEMTRVWDESKQIPVTVVKLVSQEIVRHKTEEKDGYSAIVIGANKKDLKKDKGIKTKYGMMTEFKADSTAQEGLPVGTALSFDQLGELTAVRVQAKSKGKGFQGGMKRHNFGGGPATHGSKFHRALGSTGNRKPRRTIRGQKMAGHMGDEVVTLRSVPVVDTMTIDGQQFLLLKGSIPGAYNSYVKLFVA